MNVVDEGERGARQDMHSALHSRPLRATVHVVLAAGQSVCSNAQSLGAVLHVEVEAKQFTDPLVLGNSRQPLVKQKFETVVV